MSITIGYPMYKTPYTGFATPLPLAVPLRLDARSPKPDPIRLQPIFSRPLAMTPILWAVHTPHPPKSSASTRLATLGKAIALITPAILLAKYAPSQARHELLPSDWKVWAKMLLGMASLSQINKAINWQPPPWLNAMLSVAIITPLISGVSKQALKPLILLAPAVGGLVQATHWINDKIEKPLQDNAGIPPIITKLALSVASMGVGLCTLPSLSRFASTLGATAKPNAPSAAATLAPTCATGCCTGSAICLNEMANYGSALGNWLHSSTQKQKVPSNAYFSQF